MKTQTQSTIFMIKGW